MTVEVIRGDGLDGVPHGFLGRRGGVSMGQLEGLNVGYGSGDDRDSIAENRRRAVEAVLPGAQLATVYQVHGRECLYVDRPWAEGSRPRADAMVTDKPGLLLGVLTADCAPVLFADAEAGVVGAAHAGWRGALAGVTDATIEAMERLGARRERMVAAVGPCIGQASYEVDRDFRARFIDADPSTARFFSGTEDPRPRFDLPAYVLSRLASAELGRISAVWMDTYADADRFFSYRRATHRGEPHYGRQISLIGLAG